MILNVLVAEDNKSNQMIILAILKKLGHHTDLAEDGLEALLLFAKNTYDIILMDIQMPKMDGIEACIELLKSGCKIPIIAVTANTAPGDREKCLSAGLHDYINKPLNKNKIDEIIKKYTQL
ncbi:response regulator [bacterium]|nr:response regulator [bacterium]